MTKIIEADSFETWLLERPKWLQTAAADLLETQRLPTADEIAISADLCLGESAKQDGLIFKSVPEGSFTQQLVSSNLRIERLVKVNGVNAIQKNATLNFGEANLSVVYGANGSGKSGFVRLLKHACGARVKSELLGNVFEQRPTGASAEIFIKNKENNESLTWNGSKVAALHNVQIFDAQTATSYINLKNQATYEPRRMRFISALIDICDKVAEVLKERKGKFSKRLPQMPPEFNDTPSGKFFSTLKPELTQKQIDLPCSFTKDEQEVRVALEASFKETDIEAGLKEIANQTKRLMELKAEVNTLKDGYSDEKLGLLINAHYDALAKRKSASEDAEKVFKNAPLEGVGNESWRLIWEQARKYSEQSAYVGKVFPITDGKARCVLCHQLLNNEAKSRMVAFEAFVKGGLEAQATAAEKTVKDFIDKLPAIPRKEDWSLKFENLKIYDTTIADSIFQSLTLREQSVVKATALDQLASIDWTKVDEALGSTEISLSRREDSLKKIQNEDERKKLELQLTGLKAKEWLAQQKAAVTDEVARLKKIKHIEEAEKSTRTNALTTKKNELAEVELAQGYNKRFENELRALGGKRIPVKPTAFREGKGKVCFELTLKDAKNKAQDVLSEGEMRIVALSAFLADITGLVYSAPFIFDDPISSLDQDFEEKVVERLVELAKSRQVIVFTHRLSLVTLLEEAVKRIEDRCKSMNTVPEINIYLETLRRQGTTVGVTSAFSIREKRPKKALTQMKDHVLPALRKMNPLEEGFEYKVKGLCSDFRIILERIVENVLLNDVVVRFRRSLQTMGRIGALAKIQSEDCIFIDDLMTRYSRFGHPQPEELPVEFPTPAELEEDIMKVLDWIVQFEKRQPIKQQA